MSAPKTQQRIAAAADALPIITNLVENGSIDRLSDQDRLALQELRDWLREIADIQETEHNTVAHLDASAAKCFDDYLTIFEMPKSQATRGQTLGNTISRQWSDTMLMVKVLRIASHWRQKATARLKQVTKPSQESEALAAELGRVLDWGGFDAVKVAAHSGGRPLEVTTSALLSRLGLIEKLNLPWEKLTSFLKAMEAQYKASNPYHNNTHAADVVQGLGCILASDNLAGKLTDLEVLSVVIAAVIHDVGHPGVNNIFLVRSLASEARVYNDQSVNEHSHLSTAWALLLKPENNFLCGLQDEDFRFVRKLVIDCVLGTDMAMHTKDLTAFSAAAKILGADIDAWHGDNRTMLLKFCLHASDISNPGRPWEVCLQWAQRITQEQFEQGDAERAAGLAVTPMCDRTAAMPLKGQHVFANLFCKPTFEALSLVAPSVSALALAHLQANSARYEKLLDAGETQVPDLPAAATCPAAAAS